MEDVNVNGSIYHGAKPGESEIGFIAYDKAGSTIESLCSGWAVDGKIRKYIEAHPQSILAEIVDNETGSEARFLLPAYRRGDRGAQAILNETAEDLAFGLSHVVHLLNPEVIILGGGLSLVGEPLQAAVRQSMNKFTDISYSPGPEIRITELGENVVCTGALLLAIMNSSQ